MSDELLIHVLSIGTWLPPDGATHVSGSTQLAKVEDTKPATSTTEHINNNLPIPSHLLSFYSHISKIILGNSENLVKVPMSTFCCVKIFHFVDCIPVYTYPASSL